MIVVVLVGGLFLQFHRVQMRSNEFENVTLGSHQCSAICRELRWCSKQNRSSAASRTTNRARHHHQTTKKTMQNRNHHPLSPIQQIPLSRGDQQCEKGTNFGCFLLSFRDVTLNRRICFRLLVFLIALLLSILHRPFLMGVAHIHTMGLR